MSMGCKILKKVIKYNTSFSHKNFYFLVKISSHFLHSILHQYNL